MRCCIVLNCFSLMLVLLLYERASALFESHFITFIVLSFFFFHFFSLFIDVSSVIIVFNVNYVNHSPLYPYNIIVNSRCLNHCYLKVVSTKKKLVLTRFLILSASRIF